MSSRESLTVRKFLLKKFPTDKYLDCPVQKEYYGIIQEYADAYAAEQLKEQQERTELLEKEIQELRNKLKLDLGKEDF